MPPDGMAIARGRRDTLVLVLGIVGIVLGLPFGLSAWLLGKSDLAAMDRGEMDSGGRRWTRVGMICGIVGLVVQVLILLFLGLLVLCIRASITPRAFSPW